MHRAFRAMTGLALMCLCVLAATADVLCQAGSAADREEINGLLARWEDAWNTHDMAAFASVFHEDGVWILWTGDVWKGRRLIEGVMPRCTRPCSGTALNASCSRN